MPYANNLETAAVPQVCARTHTHTHTRALSLLSCTIQCKSSPVFPLQVDNVIRAVLKSLNRKQ